MAETGRIAVERNRVLERNNGNEASGAITGQETASSQNGVRGK